MINIETAVDSLLKLVNDKKTIGLDEAAKSLGVPEQIVNEWASFLEEEKLLTIDYKMTKPFLNVAKDVKRLGEEKEELETAKENLIRSANYLLSGVLKYNVNSDKSKIRGEEDIKKLLKRKGSNEELSYARIIFLKNRVNALVNAIRNAGSMKALKALEKEVEDVEKKAKIFEKELQKK